MTAVWEIEAQLPGWTMRLTGPSIERNGEMVEISSYYVPFPRNSVRHATLKSFLLLSTTEEENIDCCVPTGQQNVLIETLHRIQATVSF